VEFETPLDYRELDAGKFSQLKKKTLIISKLNINQIVQE